MNNKFKCLLLAAVVLQSAVAVQAQDGLKNWPKGTSPQEVGKRIAERFIASPHSNFGRPVPPKTITYPEVCVWYGALNFAKESKNKGMAKQLATRFEPFFSTEASMVPIPDHVDYCVFGSVPLELYIQTKEQKYSSSHLKIQVPTRNPNLTNFEF